MSCIDNIFARIHILLHQEAQPGVIASLINIETLDTTTPSALQNDTVSIPTFAFLQKIFQEIDILIKELDNNKKILISVQSQKLLRACFQLVASLGFSPCLIPGLGISLSKRSSSASFITPSTLTDEQKYDILVACTDFFTRSYTVPLLKNIIITFHLSDYLAALIQLSFAPLKKPGSYPNITITQDMYDKLIMERQKYVDVYENLVTNCFQPILMKELLVLQSVSDPKPPGFVKKIISKEMSRRLLAPGGLLSLIRCFIESYAVDTGYEWKKVDMVSKIVCVQHGMDSLDHYLDNICNQLTQILTSRNTYYLATAIACVLSLNEKHSQSVPVKELTAKTFQSLDYKNLSKYSMPGTIILSPQEVEHIVNVLHACVCSTKLDWPVPLLVPNLFVLFLLNVKCTTNDDLKTKIDDILLKCLEKLGKNAIYAEINDFLFGKDDIEKPTFVIEDYDSGLAIKCHSNPGIHPKSESMSCLMNFCMKASEKNELIENIFEALLMILINLSEKRMANSKTESIIKQEGTEVILSDTNENYANILQFLSEISGTPKVVNALKHNPSIVLSFIEYFLLKTEANRNEECVTIALVLLNTILSESKTNALQTRLGNLIPILKKLASNDFNSVLCNEALALISQETLQKSESKCEKAISDVFDHLLPVRAHGIIELTKLIEARDLETLTKKHYIFCLFQEQLKDRDSYIYLSAINGIAALGTHCTDDVLQVLCKEFLEVNADGRDVQNDDDQHKTTELRMKVGDILVKVTKRLGEMAIVHKTLLLNTTLCGCHDDDPLIRTSALSNLAEIALVLHYKIGSIIYEVLHCIWTILDTDKVVECRRAAVMVISSLLKGLGRETLMQLKENLLPIYRALKKLYRDDEDTIVRLHAQLALEELNHVVNEFLFPELKLEKQIFLLDKSEDIHK